MAYPTEKELKLKYASLLVRGETPVSASRILFRPYPDCPVAYVATAYNFWPFDPEVEAEVERLESIQWSKTDLDIYIRKQLVTTSDHEQKAKYGKLLYDSLAGALDKQIKDQQTDGGSMVDLVDALARSNKRMEAAAEKQQHSVMEAVADAGENVPS
jgi:hypothetical protein